MAREAELFIENPAQKIENYKHVETLVHGSDMRRTSSLVEKIMQCWFISMDVTDEEEEKMLFRGCLLLWLGNTLGGTFVFVIVKGGPLL